MKDLADRMKRYEFITRHYLTRRSPIIIRLDGKCFHTLTRNCNRPFDQSFIDSMVLSAKETCREIQGFKLAFIQSDEVNILVTDYDELNTQGWFDYNISKILSISAGMMSVYFSENFENSGIFDSRVFNIPKEDISNYFVWRAKDWARNSLNMYAQSFFSHKELMNKHSSAVHEMLHAIGKNWAIDLPGQHRNGTWFTKDECEIYTILPDYQEIEYLWTK
ncbi:hypothetical protein LCGC14_1777840 [marine sediment metagenome]|uniref:tRNAHis guanylyltransferase catalytic domain-containing protein n=1 Tax=marine sediment metagenome TaxID=412755 RepID=A0A0F9GWE3_9ZZZZ|nr:hypothetical protein [Porticoccus sp.]